MATAAANAVSNFASAGEEDYSDVHSPTDTSEDSVDVKVLPISPRNKRKCAEPRRVHDAFTGPLKKRMCFKVKAEIAGSHPFRPWSPNASATKQNQPVDNLPENSVVKTGLNLIVKSENVDEKSESLVIKSEQFEPKEVIRPIQSPVCIKTEIPIDQSSARPVTNYQNSFLLPSLIVPNVPLIYNSNVQVNTHKYGYFRPPSPISPSSSDDQPVSLIKKQDNKDKEEDCISDKIPSRVPVHPQITTLSTAETERLILNTNESFPSLQNKHKSDQTCLSRREQRNYKNMTRERRMEANARERTRVHTISAAYDTLRKSVPAYSHNQKLSKLSVLRIASAYIKTLSSILEGDTETMVESVDTVSKTIQREGKLRKKKDDND